jgi:hypothetical protein
MSVRYEVYDSGGAGGDADSARHDAGGAVGGRISTLLSLSLLVL